jgi:hypothetical protein
MAKGGKIDHLRRNLAELLHPEGAAASKAKPAAARRGAAPPAPRAEVSFSDKIKILLAQSGQKNLLSGRVNLIGLYKIKERFGASWEKVADRADRIARNTIERHLVSGDIYTGLHGVAYVVVFARLSADQAQIKCTIIGDEIAKALLGEQGTDLLTVKSSIKSVDGSFMLESIKLADEAGPRDDDLEFVEENADASGRNAADESRAPMLTRKETALASLHFAYRPMWDSGRNVVSAYRCVAQAPSPDGGSALVDAAGVIGNDAVAIQRLDEAVLGRVLKHLDELLRDNCTLLLSLPVHFETLGAVARRRQYAETLNRALDDRGRKLLLVEVQGIPLGVPQARFVELLAPLRAHCRAIMLRLPIETIDFSNVKGCGALAVGCDIGGHAGPEFILMQQMNRFARAASDKTGLPTSLHGASSLSLVTAALGAGFTYIDGDAVAKLIDDPRGLVDFRLADLYRPLTSG